MSDQPSIIDLVRDLNNALAALQAYGKTVATYELKGPTGPGVIVILDDLALLGQRVVAVCR